MLFSVDVYLLVVCVAAMTLTSPQALLCKAVFGVVVGGHDVDGVRMPHDVRTTLWQFRETSAVRISRHASVNPHAAALSKANQSEIQATHPRNPPHALLVSS